jgi:hypothetical protein
MAIEMADTLARSWDTSSDQDKQGLARSVFEYLVYDLDTQRIVSFRLKSWADRYLILRAALYEETQGQEAENKHALTKEQGVYKAMPHRGFEPLFWP